MSDKTFHTADLIDFAPDTPTCVQQFRDVGGKKRFCGKIRTVRCKEDNGLVKKALNEPSQGEVLIVDGSGSTSTALMGDMIAQAGMNNGWSGGVIFGCGRDSAALGEMSFGVKALGVIPKKSAKDGKGERDVTLSLGGVDFVPGEFVYCDEDGIIVAKAPFPLED